MFGDGQVQFQQHAKRGAVSESKHACPINRATYCSSIGSGIGRDAEASRASFFFRVQLRGKPFAALSTPIDKE